MQRLGLKLDLTAVIVLLAVGVLLPVLLSTAVGIVTIVIAGSAGGIVTGVLVICFTAAAAGSALVSVVLTARKTRLARLQSDFIANVTHEFRTPLASIRLHTQTLQSGIITNDRQQTAVCLSTILRETECLDAMFDKVLAWRASAGDMLPLKMISQPVAGAVNEALARFRNMTPPDEIELTQTGHTRLNVNHDVKAVGAAVLNLLTNAYKHTGPRKRIRLELRDEGSEALISVTDNGAGLPAGEKERIFQPFHRIMRPDGGDPGGAGLGLAIVRHIVKKHGGVIQAANAEEGGAVFTIRLPATDRPS